MQKNNETKKYSFGIKFLEIASFIIEDFDLIKISRDPIDKLNEAVKETIHLGIIVRDKAVYLYKKESNYNIKMYSQVGRSIPYIEAVFGQIKTGGFRRFSLRGFKKAGGEFSLVYAVSNFKKIVNMIKDQTGCSKEGELLLQAINNMGLRGGKV